MSFSWTQQISNKDKLFTVQKVYLDLKQNMRTLLSYFVGLFNDQGILSKLLMHFYKGFDFECIDGNQKQIYSLYICTKVNRLNLITNGKYDLFFEKNSFCFPEIRLSMSYLWAECTVREGLKKKPGKLSTFCG